MPRFQTAGRSLKAAFKNWQALVPYPEAAFHSLESIVMGLFKSDLYRAFFLGFGTTAVLMAAQFAPHVL